MTPDEAALAAIIGDLWDWPPDAMPSQAQYRQHLADRYGEDVAAVWDRLVCDQADRWTLEAAGR